MEPEKYPEEMTAVTAPVSQNHSVIFLPFLQLKHGHKIAGVEFLPFRDPDGKVPESLQPAEAPLKKILSGYVHRHGKLPFVELANTDDDFMREHAEAILMGSAFEQLVRGDASAYKLGKRFEDLLAGFGSVTVADAKNVRPDIEIDTSTPDIAAAQQNWWVHRKWIEELYDVRSKVVHKGSHASRPWGWSLFEHLVMAAQVFPLIVKLLLEKEGHYALSDEDRVRCLAVDIAS